MSVTNDSLPGLLRTLKLPSFVSALAEVSTKAEQEGWSFERFLRQLAEVEIEDRRRRRVERLLRSSGLPHEKTLATLDRARLPVAVRRQLPNLSEGGFAERCENLLAFGLPGRGKTHLVSAIGYELVQRGVSVLFLPAFKLVQRLLVAKRDLELEIVLKRLDRFEVVILDDIGYVQHSREEMEVLFTFLSERYERKSVMITSNLVFSEWDKIFKDPMTTACAIDRLVHHATILELSGKSYRAQVAVKNNNNLRRKS